MGGGDSKMATQAVPATPPPPPSGGSAGQNGGFTLPPTWGPAKMTRQGPARDPPPVTWLVGRGGGKKRHFFKYSLIKDYFMRPISQNLSAKLAPNLLQCQSLPTSFLRAVRRENAAYIVIQAYIRPAKTAAFLSRLHYILQATSLQKAVKIKNKAGHNSTRGTVSSLLFSRWKVLLHTVYIFYVDWGYRFKTPIVKEAFR